VTAIFSTTEYSWIWLIARIYIGWNWLDAGRHKLASDAWMDGGAALQRFWQAAISIPEKGRPPISYDWYREFLEFMLNHGWEVWFGPLVAVGETLVGIGLIVGAFTGIAAFFGAAMNWNFMLAGTASTNPVLGLIGIGVMIAWKTAGWWGIDRVLLPRVGAPWQPGALFGGEKLLAPNPSHQQFLRSLEEWARMLAGVGLLLYALIGLTGATQVAILLVAAAAMLATGVGWFFIFPRSRTEP
jgi:thiosulfate dehydrogenase [quinone] large subunit